VVGYRYQEQEFAHIDYASNDGSTIRFGDNAFGATPMRGTLFRARYLTGNGRRANLPAGAIVAFDPAVSAIVSAVDNPFAVDGGIDPEEPEAIRQLAPEAFRATTYRAVRPEDYAEAVERLDWVQRAGCSFRWTGSWLSAFVAADPLGGVEASDDERTQMIDQLDRFRQAGREVIVRNPVYADIDLKIAFCVAPDAYPAEVFARVQAALSGTPGAFFSDDNFTFGTPLDRARLEAAIQDIQGVRAVESISFRRRGVFGWRPFSTMIYRAAPHEVIRVENDPLHPDRGSIQLSTDGGA
jgi:predicted phage baseplate assembly protein